MQGIKVDFITNTIIITKEFAALASDPTSEEYVTLNLCQYSGHLKCDFYAAQGAIL